MKDCLALVETCALLSAILFNSALTQCTRPSVCKNFVVNMMCSENNNNHLEVVISSKMTQMSQRSREPVDWCSSFSYLGKQWAADRIQFSVMMEPPQMWPSVPLWKPRGGKRVSHLCITGKSLSQQVSLINNTQTKPHIYLPHRQNWY